MNKTTLIPTHFNRANFKLAGVKLTALAMACAVGSFASAANADTAYDYARVTRVTPVYEKIEHRIPREECWMETVRTNDSHNNHAAGTIVGGVVGGALGHTVGHGHKNRKIGTVVGTIVGMSVGNHVSRQRDQGPRYEEFQRCETRYTTEISERFDGYDVTYRYLGKSYTTHLRHDPGDRIRVAVNVSPVLGE